MSTSIARVERDPDESIDVMTLIAEVVAEPDAWMAAPNDQLGGAKPKDLLGTDREIQVRELARAIKIGMFT